jgi:hypothetical protein
VRQQDHARHWAHPTNTSFIIAFYLVQCGFRGNNGTFDFLRRVGRSARFRCRFFIIIANPSVDGFLILVIFALDSNRSGGIVLFGDFLGFLLIGYFLSRRNFRLFGLPLFGSWGSYRVGVSMRSTCPIMIKVELLPAASLSSPSVTSSSSSSETSESSYLHGVR